MVDGLLEPRIVRMPPLAVGEWLNGRPLTNSQLRGQVVLVDFWDYTCINCLRTLPYLKQWYQRYAKHGLVIIGIHTPEFRFAQFRHHLEAAVAEYEIPYPILLDNQQKNWSQFAARAWPTKFLVDADGYLRFQRQGEGYYQQTEQAIQTLLRLRDPDLTLPDLLPPLRPEDNSGAVCYRPTPELHAGFQGGGLFGGALGNPEGYMPDSSIIYQLPPVKTWQEGCFYVDGIWRAWPEALAFAGEQGGEIVLPYSAVSVNAVLAPSADPVETALKIRPTEAAPVVEVVQDGRYLTKVEAGSDVMWAENGRSFVRVDRPRMVNLVQNPDFEQHTLRLSFQARGLALYAFTFTGCVASPQNPHDAETFQMP
ncbi:redoxin domain-containing protein [Candidatus Leptofilum sp.]|uniref:redoxin domain-containing protein n=1 Tax=Candidatus Leptofilum sp. TaxID=3241576 RepID=UPI003B5A4FC1